MSGPSPGSVGTLGADFERLGLRIRANWAEDERTAEDLPGGGRLYLDRPLPFLIVHRCPSEQLQHATCGDAHDLVTPSPAYLYATGGEPVQAGLSSLLKTLADEARNRFGGFLALDVWVRPAAESDDVDPFHRSPGFTLHVPHGQAEALTETVEALDRALQGIEIDGLAAHTRRLKTERPAPPRLPPLLQSPPPDVFTLGLAVDEIFLNELTGEFYPVLLRRLRDALAEAVSEAVYGFARVQTQMRPPGPYALGRHGLADAARRADSELAACADAFDFLLQVTPINADAAWAEFESLQYEQPPDLLYRPLTFRPDELRCRLYALPLDEVEDPLVAGLFRERREEIDRQVGMMLNRGTRFFHYGSLELYGAPDDDLVALAKSLLGAAPHPRSRSKDHLDADAFAALARDELAFYRDQYARFDATVTVRPDITASLMVSQGQLLIGEGAHIPEARARALLAHEVGTHVLTYYNGRAQPLALFYGGTADYEDLQEGIAVLAEYLVGGLNPTRLRTLAGRVVGAHALVEGAGFVDVFRLLHRDHDFSTRAAFTITLRLLRGGGLTKDMVYLRGLRDLLAFLAEGNALEPLLVGKIALRHARHLDELHQRQILVAPPLSPRFLAGPQASERLAWVREGLTVLDLIEA